MESAGSRFTGASRRARHASTERKTTAAVASRSAITRPPRRRPLARAERGVAGGSVGRDLVAFLLGSRSSVLVRFCHDGDARLILIEKAGDP
jgi:hypothetical protein